MAGMPMWFEKNHSVRAALESTDKNKNDHVLENTSVTL